MKDELTNAEAAQVKLMVDTEGWKVIREKLSRRFKEKYNKLRTSNRDSAFYKIQGYLDCIDEIFRIINQTILDEEV